MIRKGGRVDLLLLLNLIEMMIFDITAPENDRLCRRRLGVRVVFRNYYMCAKHLSSSALGAGALRARSIHFKTHVHVHHTEEGKPSLRCLGARVEWAGPLWFQNLKRLKMQEPLFMLSFKSKHSFRY
jgi:hypothetical protein